MNVLNIYRTYFPDPPGGLQEAIRQTCLATNDYGVNNSVFTLSKQPDPKIINRPEAAVYRSRSWISPASCDIGSLEAFINFSQRAKESDLLHFYHPWPFADMLGAMTHCDKPQLMTYISDIVRQKLLGKLYQPLMYKTLKSMDIIIANCPAYIETSPVLAHPSIRDKVRVIPLGIDEHSYPTQADMKYIEKFGLNDGEPYFLFLGVLRYYKGIHTLIRAAKHVNAKIVIAGSGPESTSLKKLVQELGIKNINFTGQVSEIEKVSLLKNCLALILPSHLRSEAYGMVLVEASMFSKPMISCEIGTGTSFINQQGETGFVIQPENELELSESMNTLLMDTRLAKVMGEKARVRYEKNFSSDALGKSYSSVYKELI